MAGKRAVIAQPSLYRTVALFLSLLVSACVSIPAARLIHGDAPAVSTIDARGTCDPAQIRRASESAGYYGPGLDPGRISILNWNIFKGRRDNWATDLRRFSTGRDIITLQEAHLDQELRSLIQQNFPDWVMNLAFYLDDMPAGVLTASKVRPLYSCGQRATEPLIRTPKTSLVTLYPVAGMHQKLLVANIHGVNFSLGLKAYRHQIEALHDIVSHHDGPVVLAGDFNTWNEARLDILLNMTRRLSLNAIDYAAHNRTRLYGFPLDHVFYRGLVPVEHGTHDVISSDHNPIHVIFRIESGETIIPHR